MKKVILLLFLATTSLFVSCDNDEDPIPVIDADPSLVTGAWNLTALSIENGKTTTQTEGQTVSIDYTTVGKDFDMVVTFTDNTNPSTFATIGSYTAVVTTSILGQSITEEQPITDFLGTGEWRIEGNMLFTKVNDIEKGSEIVELNEERMVLKVEINETIMQQGVNAVTTGVAMATMTKM